MPDTSRLILYGHSLLNMAGIYTSAQTAAARTIFDFWQAHGCDDDSAAAFVGCAEGECSFLHVGGDRVGGEATAWGIAQWHAARRDVVRARSGEDVWAVVRRPDGSLDNDLPQQLRGQLAEVTEAWSLYRNVLRHVITADGLEAKVRVLVHEFEQSGSQDRDVARRTPMAAYWRQRFNTGATS